MEEWVEGSSAEAPGSAGGWSGACVCTIAGMAGVSHREVAVHIASPGEKEDTELSAGRENAMTTNERGAAFARPRHLFTLHHPPGDRANPSERAKRGILREAGSSDEERDRSFRRVILSIPAGRVSTYGKVAAAAGYPMYHRAVARLLRMEPPDQLPWHRVLGAGGEIRLPGSGAEEQRARLALEGVAFRGRRVDMDRFEHGFRGWEISRVETSE